MKGTRANLPCANKSEGSAGINPPGPSITGAKGNDWSPEVITLLNESTSVLRFARRRQLNVSDSPVLEHSGVAFTKDAHAGSRMLALNIGTVD